MTREEVPFWCLLFWLCWYLVVSHVLLAVRVLRERRAER